ncbi:hypothetical protein GW796_05940 [archaeon]|nr:hypothetical protein [archaeon]NCQ51425.1 hypothetical protein [archaeon]NCT58749.1 hypothetical protein [archaeon]
MKTISEIFSTLCEKKPLSLSTKLFFKDYDNDIIDPEVEVFYDIEKGMKGDRETPDEGDVVEILKIINVDTNKEIDIDDLPTVTIDDLKAKILDYA